MRRRYTSVARSSSSAPRPRRLIGSQRRHRFLQRYCCQFKSGLHSDADRDASYFFPPGCHKLLDEHLMPSRITRSGENAEVGPVPDGDRIVQTSRNLSKDSAGGIEKPNPHVNDLADFTAFPECTDDERWYRERKLRNQKLLNCINVARSVRLPVNDGALAGKRPLQLR